MEKNISLSADKMGFLNSRRLPFILTAPQTAALLGIPQHGLSVLIGAKLLKPLGEASERGRNNARYFSAHQIMMLQENAQALSRMVTVLSKKWREKNGRCRSNEESGPFENEECDLKNN